VRESVILFPNAGGLGDIICAEPVFRFGINHVFTESDDIVIASDLPEIFSHLEGDHVTIQSLTEINAQASKYKNLYQLRKTFIDKQTAVQGIVHQTMHVVDYMSLVCLQMAMPDKEKRVVLEQPTPSEVESITAKFKEVGVCLKRTLLLHPGKTWSSRTIPEDWWDKFNQLAQDSNIPVCAIGKTNSTRPGAVPVSVIELKNIPSLINKLSLRELITAVACSWGVITNESCPIIISGAFDNYLFAFATFRPWEMVKPYGHDKSFNLARKALFPPSWHRPTQYSAQSDEIPSGVSLEDIIFSPREALELICGVFS